MRTEGGMAVPDAVLKCCHLSPSRLPASSSSTGKGFRDFKCLSPSLTIAPLGGPAFL